MFTRKRHTAAIGAAGLLMVLVCGAAILLPRPALGFGSDSQYEFDKDYVMETRARALDDLEYAYANLSASIIYNRIPNMGKDLVKLDATISEASLLYEAIQDLDRADWTKLSHSLDRKIDRAKELTREIGKAIDSTL